MDTERFEIHTKKDATSSTSLSLPPRTPIVYCAVLPSMLVPSMRFNDLIRPTITLVPTAALIHSTQHSVLLPCCLVMPMNITWNRKRKYRAERFEKTEIQGTRRRMNTALTFSIFALSPTDALRCPAPHVPPPRLSQLCD
jgi:hypothetical protein